MRRPIKLLYYKDFSQILICTFLDKFNLGYKLYRKMTRYQNKENYNTFLVTSKKGFFLISE